MEQVPIHTLAEWFLAKESMTHKKLQKICYYGVAWGWALLNSSIIEDDKFEAWVHGPVAPKLYRAYKDCGWNDIPLGKTKVVPNAIKELLEAVWLTYGDKSGNELEALSHSERPWRQARKGLPDEARSTEPISPAVMRKFYNSIKSTEY